MMTSSTPGSFSESDTYPANYQPHAAYLQSRLTARRHSLTPGHQQHTSSAGSSSNSGQSATQDPSTPSKSTRIIRRGSLQPTSSAALAAAAAAGGGMTPRRRTGSINDNSVRWSNDVDGKKPAAVENSAVPAAAATPAATDPVAAPSQQQSADASELIDGFVKQVDEAAIAGNRRPLPKPSGAFAAALGVSE